MTRIRTLAIGAITTAMIFGSTIALAMDSADQAADQTVADPSNGSIMELAQPGPQPKRGGGGSGKALKK